MVAEVLILKAHVNIFTFNMNGGGSTSTDHKWLHINEIMRDKKLGIGAIQEMHLTEEKQEELEKRFPRLKLINSWDQERPNLKGVVICINRQLMRANETTSMDLIPERAIITSIPWTHQGDTLNVLGIYAPNVAKEQKDFWEDLDKKLEKIKDKLRPNVMLGDFNTTENKLDRLLPRNDNRVVVEQL
ncbi:hypothetical protein CVT24_010458 [Panaeolus cyanescens]|uniref:Endonuclease/exonuclease/phosphatase domain-containing protein n=1 Tax=Panaeolus cyanescens TaxID=181874 RepID=A0A409YQH3_9AGAR|nr:hypothetical protein CVT24_010458 [Panaeolus cyanescens]